MITKNCNDFSFLCQGVFFRTLYRFSCSSNQVPEMKVFNGFTCVIHLLANSLIGVCHIDRDIFFHYCYVLTSINA